MDIQQIQYFIKAAELKNFSKAARELFISPQALTKQINLLEAELKTQLFLRSPRGVELTDIGIYAQAKLGKINHDFIDTVADLNYQIAHQKRKIKVGFFASLPKDELISPAVTLLLASVPDCQVELTMVDLFEARDLLMTGKLDLLFTNTHEEENWFQMERFVFSNHPARVVVSLLHPWAIKDEITQEDMKQYAFLKMEPFHTNYNLNESESFYSNVPCKSITPVGNFNTLMTLLEQGDGFGVFPMVFADMKTARFKDFTYPGRQFNFQTALLYNPENPLPEVHQLISLFQEEYA